MIPHPGQVYRSPEGLPMFYVRTEQRPGSDAQEHAFATARDRTVFLRWLLEVPPQMELVIDTGGQQRANEETWLRLVAEMERDLAFELLKEACSWLPPERSGELRRRWSERQPPERDE